MTITTFMSLSEMRHPALTVLPWEHADEERQGVHGTASIGLERRVDGGPVFHFIHCYCGWDTGDCRSDREAFDALVAHATPERCEYCGEDVPVLTAPTGHAYGCPGPVDTDRPLIGPDLWED